MSQQLINLGSAPNDGTGDSIREGGDKINDNFTELYARENGITDWDMDTNLFPSSSKKGQRYFGIITTSSTLVDNQSPPQPLPSRIIATSLQDNASTSNPAHWAFQTTQ